MKKSAQQFKQEVLKYISVLIYISGSPDPDGLASAYALKWILNHHGVAADIYAEQKISLPQNQLFVDRLRIPVTFAKQADLNRYQAYIVPDFQSNRIADLSDRLPCAAHIDHHARTPEAVKCDFSLVRTDAGSTSTLVALLLKNLDLELSPADLNSVATALVFGIQTDTDKYNHITPLDLEALNYLAAFADSNVLKGLNSIPPSPHLLEFYRRLKKTEIVYRDWGFYGLGFIDARHRDSIALAADMILESSGHSLVAVYAIIENHTKKTMYLDVSLRTGKRNIDLNRIIKQITPGGGGRRYKGAYQVNLDYFRQSPNKEKLWTVVETTTIDLLRKSRDTIYIAGIETIYSAAKDKLRSLFK